LTKPPRPEPRTRAKTQESVISRTINALELPNHLIWPRLISTRHSQKRSTIITTNTPFSDWGNILFNTTSGTAIADRLVENSEVFLLDGESLRKPKNPNPSAEKS
jgi:DNA replication protein DnaC